VRRSQSSMRMPTASTDLAVESPMVQQLTLPPLSFMVRVALQ